MEIKKLYIVALFAVAGMATASAQTLHSAYFTDGYLYSHTMNPAMADTLGYVSIPVLGNINISTMGNFGLKDVLRDNPLYPEQSDKKKTTFLNPYISDPLKGFSKGNNKVSAQADVTLMSVGFKAFGGYNTVELNAHARSYVKLPYELFNFAVNAGNGNYNIGDIYARAFSYAEVALGHSRDLNDKWRVGAKLKLLLGIEDADVQMKDVQAQLTGNTWLIKANAQAHMSMKGFTYKSKQKDYKSQGGQYEYINDVDVDGTGIGGVGMAVDLGAVYKPAPGWEVSAAVTDLGFISWSSDHYARNNEQEFTFDGFHDIDVNKGESNTPKNQSDKYSDQLSQFANLQDQGDQGSRTTGIGAHINLGASYTLPSYNKLKLGLLSTTCLQGVHTWTELRGSGNWSPLKWLSGNLNVAASSYACSLGWMLNVHPRGFNFFIGMDHLLGKMSKEYIPLSSNASLSTGFNITF